MAIDSLRSGIIRICFSDALNAYPSKCRILVEGQMLDTGTAEDGALIKVPSTRGIDELFGAGSVICEALKVGFTCCGNNAMEFYALPHHDTAVGATTKAAYTITFTGDATSPGTIDLYIADGQWNTSTRIYEGMTQDEIAAAVLASIQDEPSLPFTIAAGTAPGANVLTLTAKNAGTVGNNIAIIPNWRQRLNYLPEGVEIVVAQTTQGANQLTGFMPPDYAAILGECCYCCFAMCYDNQSWQDAAIAYIKDNWSCAKPQCFGHGYTYNSGTLGQILAADTNSPEVSRLAQCATDPSAGWLKAVAYATLSCCSTVDNPELSIQGPNFGVLNCLRQPESCFQCFTFDEQELLRQSGFVVTVPLQNGAGQLTAPMITNDITNNRYDADGRLNATWWNVNARRLAMATADSMAIMLNKSVGLGLYTKNTTIPAGIYGTNPKLILGSIRAWAKDKVGILFSEFDNIDKDITVQTDFEVAPRCQGIPGKLWVNFIYRPPVRISNIIVNAYPEMLSNC